MARFRAIKNHCIASLGEFVGTFLFLFFAFAGTQTANEATSTGAGPDLTQLMYISLIFGFSLAINVWIFFRVSGGLFNPAVTLALCIAGVVPVLRSVFIFFAQMLGGIAAAAVVRGLIPGDGIRFNCSLRPGTSIAQGLFLEMFLTAELVFAILMLAAEKTKATFVAPVGIGLALFVAELVGVYWTGGALNPSRAFGPEAVMGSFNRYHWIYWIGPILGALLASAFYKLLKFFNYEEVNGDQDKSPEDEKVHEAVKHASRNDIRGHKAFDRRLGPGSGSRRSNHSSSKYQNGNGDLQDQRYSREEYHSDSRNPHMQYEQNQQQPPAASETYNKNSPRSRAFIPEPDPLRVDRQTVRAAGPFPVMGRDGQPYVQDVNAQNRASRSSSEKRTSRDYRNDEDVRRGGSNRRYGRRDG